MLFKATTMDCLLDTNFSEEIKSFTSPIDNNTMDLVEPGCLHLENRITKIGNVFATLWDIYNPFGDSITDKSMCLLKNDKNYGQFKCRRRKNLYEIFHVKIPSSPLVLMHRALMDSGENYKNLYLNEYLRFFKQLPNKSMRYALPCKTVDVINSSKPTIIRTVRNNTRENVLKYNKRSMRVC